MRSRPPRSAPHRSARRPSGSFWNTSRTRARCGPTDRARRNADPDDEYRALRI